MMLLWFHFNKLMTMSTKYGITKKFSKCDLDCLVQTAEKPLQEREQTKCADVHLHRLNNA